MRGLSIQTATERVGQGLRVLLAATVATCSFAAVSASTQAGAVAPTARLAVPTYFTDEGTWRDLLADPASVGLVLVNPASGPGSTVDPTYAALVARVRSAGVRPLGYVPTSYGDRSLNAVRADMAAYRSLYGIDSFFFDEVPNVCTETVSGTLRDHVGYYGSLYQSAHTVSDGFAVLNPGTNVPTCFLAISDVIVNFEASAATYASWEPLPWMLEVPATHFWHLIHSVGTSNRAAVATQAVARHAGYVYATDDLMPNPWDGLGDPTSFEVMRGALTMPPRNVAPTVSTPSTTIVGRAPAPTVPVVTTPASPSNDGSAPVRTPVGAAGPGVTTSPAGTGAATLTSSSDQAPPATMQPSRSLRTAAPSATAVTGGSVVSGPSTAGVPTAVRLTAPNALAAAPIVPVYGQSDDSLDWLRRVEFGDDALLAH